MDSTPEVTNILSIFASCYKNRLHFAQFKLICTNKSQITSLFNFKPNFIDETKYLLLLGLSAVKEMLNP